jgi:hypothetical protein
MQPSAYSYQLRLLRNLGLVNGQRARARHLDIPHGAS